MTSMEKFHWLDQNPELPNFVFATLRFTTRIDPEIARRSLAIALGRQPLAAMEPKLISGRWCWEPIPNIQLDGDQVFCSRNQRDPEDASNPSESLTASHELKRDYVSCFLSVSNFSELASSNGMMSSTDRNAHLTSLSDEATVDKVVSEIRFHSHHAASDGVSSVGLVNDWLMIYNNLVAGEPAESGLIELDDSSFQNRGVLGLLSWNYLKGLPQQAIALFGAAKFIFRKTKNVAAETEPIEAPAAYPAIKGRWINAATLKADRAQATKHQVGFTAWCLAKCFIAIDNWNQKRDSQFGGTPSVDQTKSNSVWRILLPMSTRGTTDRAAVAANRTAIVQIDRQPPADGADPIPFCQAIDYEIKFIRRYQLEKMFLIAIRLASLSNSWLAKTANNPVSRGAAVFTHLGRPFKRAMIHLNRLSKSAPNSQLARLVDFDLVGPVRSGTPVNVSFARFDHRLKITLHYDSQVISNAEADRLLATITDLFSTDAG